MPDQAQGLRALADQARRDTRVPTFLSAPNQTLSLEEPSAANATTFADVLTPVGIPNEAAVAAQRLFDLSTPAVVASPYVPVAVTRHARVIAVTSGKGGVGKTNFFHQSLADNGGVGAARCCSRCRFGIGESSCRSWRFAALSSRTRHAGRNHCW